MVSLSARYQCFICCASHGNFMFFQVFEVDTHFFGRNTEASLHKVADCFGVARIFLHT